jgi:thiamine pyrophosphokinase
MAEILHFDRPVVLIGGGASSPEDLGFLGGVAPHIVAADGGANHLRRWSVTPDAIIGDMDSVSDEAFWRSSEGVNFLPVAEQDSTDLEKCLRLTRAPCYFGLGFFGGRFDHSLAALHALLAFADRKLILVGPDDLTFLAPLDWRARLAPGAVVSIYPLRPVKGIASTGLRWSVEGLAMEAGGRIGSSNAAAAADVSVKFDRVGALITLERRFLQAAMESLG